MITSMELENWRAHGSTKIEFAKGTNILIGQMGAGKSSIMDALSFALFGTFPSIKNRKIAIGDIISNRPSQKSIAKVSLSFTAGEDSYKVEREISLKEPAKAKLEKNGRYVQSQPQRVTEEIEKALKVDYDLFSRAIYSEQNKIDYFLELNSSARKKQVDNLLGLDRFSTAQENATSLMNRLKEMISESERIASSLDSVKIAGQLKVLEDELKRGEEEQEVLSGRIEKINKEKAEISRKLSSIKESYAKKQSLGKEVAGAKSKLEVINREIGKLRAKQLPEKATLEREIAARESALQKARDEEKQILNRLQQIQAKKARAEQVLAKAHKDMGERESLEAALKAKSSNSVRSNIEKSSKELEVLQKELASCEAQSQEARKWVAELEKHVSKCPVCERDLTEEIKAMLISRKKEAAELSSAKAAGMKEAISKKRNEINAFEKELRVLTLAEEKLKLFGDIGKAIAESEKELASAAAEERTANQLRLSKSEEVSGSSEVLAGMKASREAIERHYSLKKERSKTEAEMLEKEKSISEITADQKDIDEASAAFVKISEEASKTAAMLSNISRELKDKAVQISEKKAEIKKIESIYKEISQKKAIIENISKFKNALQETQLVLRTRLINAINEIMQNMWPELYPYGDYSGVALMPSEDDYVLQLKVRKNGEETWTDVESIASGGERSIACIAMRVAFALVLVPNLKWLILDEPTHNIDKQGIDSFVNVFSETLPKVVDQIFIITHDEQLKQISNGKIYLLSRNKEAGEATFIEEA